MGMGISSMLDDSHHPVRHTRPQNKLSPSLAGPHEVAFKDLPANEQLRAYDETFLATGIYFRTQLSHYFVSSWYWPMAL